MNLNDNKEELLPGKFPVERRVHTDTLCLHFSWPLSLIIFNIFIFVIICGRTFSFLHPGDKNGLRCGIDNSIFNPDLTDFQDKPYLSYKSKCVDECSGIVVFSYCIPKDRKSLKDAPLSFKLISDLLQYWKFAIFIMCFTFVLAFPCYFLCAKFSMAIIYLLLLSVGFGSLFLIAKGLYSHSFALVANVLGLAITYIFILLYIKRRIHVIGPMITSAFKYLLKAKAVFFLPLFLIFGSILILLFVIFGILFTDGVGQPIASYSSIKIEQHPSLKITKFLFPFLGFWFIEFLFVWVRFAVSFITGSLYFKHRVPSVPESLKITLKYHSGTIFFGSFVVFFLEALSVFFTACKKWLKKSKNSFVKFICKCILNLCFILVKFISEINRLSFVFTSIEGVSFWDGCKKATKVYQNDSLLSISLLMHNIFFGARLIVALLACIFTYRYAEGLMKPLLPVFTIPFFVYFTLSAVDTIISSSTQTVLICMLEDAKEDGAYAPKELKSIMSWLKEITGAGTSIV